MSKIFKTESELHMMALSKSEDSAKIKPSMKVVRLGFVTTMLNEIQKEFKKEISSKSCDRCKFGKIGVDHNGLEIDCSLNWKCSRGYSDKFEAKGE